MDFSADDTGEHVVNVPSGSGVNHLGESGLNPLPDSGDNHIQEDYAGSTEHMIVETLDQRSHTSGLSSGDDAIKVSSMCRDKNILPLSLKS